MELDGPIQRSCVGGMGFRMQGRGRSWRDHCHPSSVPPLSPPGDKARSQVAPTPADHGRSGVKRLDPIALPAGGDKRGPGNRVQQTPLASQARGLEGLEEEQGVRAAPDDLSTIMPATSAKNALLGYVGARDPDAWLVKATMPGRRRR